MTEHPADALKREFRDNAANGRVGSILVSQSDRVRVWHLHMRPGERLPVHRHQLDYFWTAVTPGRARSHYDDGRVVEADYKTGDTKHFKFAKGEFFMHDVENIGDTDLIFTTVEFLDSANPPLDL